MPKKEIFLIYNYIVCTYIHAYIHSLHHLALQGGLFIKSTIFVIEYLTCRVKLHYKTREI